MPIESLDQIQSNFNSLLNPITSLSTTDGEKKAKKDGFLKSNIKMFDFDALAKKVGGVTCSPDALTLNGDMVHFVEFKNQKLSKIEIRDCLNKFYDGLSVFGLSSQNGKTIDKIQVHFTIICNPEKNAINTERSCEENLLFGVMQSNLENSGNNPISDKEMSNYQKMKEGKFQHMKKLLSGLSKFGINVEVDALLIQDEIDEFLSQFESNPQINPES